MMKVKYLSKQQIEWNTEKLLADFGKSFGVVEQPPIPVEEILETHLKLTMEFDNLRSRLGFPDILGALWAPDRLVAIDESLDTNEYPQKEGRYRYTVGHEIGHWEQHRHYFLPDPNQYTIWRTRELRGAPARKHIQTGLKGERERIIRDIEKNADCHPRVRSAQLQDGQRRSWGLSRVAYRRARSVVGFLKKARL